MIYNNNEQILLAEQSQLLTEGFTINKNPPVDFYKTALNITNEIIDIIGNLNIQRTIYNGKNFKNGTAKMKYNNSFTRSADRARNSIKSREIGKMPLSNMNSKFSISLYIGSLSWDYNPSYVAQEVSKPVIKSGFYLMNKSKNFLKRIFQNIYLYKPLSDKSLMVIKFGISYATQNGAFAGWTNITVHFKAVVNDEKSLRALNIIEAGNIEQLSEGIFDRFKKKNNPTPEEARMYKQCEDKLEEILSKHRSNHHSIINRVMSRNPDIKKELEFIDDAPTCFFGTRLSGHLFSVDIYALNIDLDDEEACLEPDKLITECINELNLYNKKNNIDFIKYRVDDGSVIYDVEVSIIKSMLRSISELYIFESVEFI